MIFYSVLLLAVATFFVLSWIYVAWLKIREHRNILREEQQIPQPVDDRRMRLTQSKSDRQNRSRAHSTVR
jgi:hypothetical protein